MNYIGPLSMALPADYSPDGDREYGPDCSECGCEMELVSRYGGYPVYECVRCGHKWDTFYDAVDEAYDREKDR